ATTTSPSRTWTSPLFASTATGKASNDPQRRDPGGLPHVPGGDGRAEHRHGARPYRCLPNPSPVTRHREVLPMTDTNPLWQRIEHALWGDTQVYDARDRRGTEVGVHAPVYEVVAAVLPIVPEEVRKAKAGAWQEGVNFALPNAETTW